MNTFTVTKDFGITKISAKAKPKQESKPMGRSVDELKARLHTIKKFL